jgi:hypothetical protein
MPAKVPRLQAHRPKLAIKKPKLLRSNPLRLSLIKQGTQPSDIDFDDEDILVETRRQVHKVQADPDEELSDYVKFRLFLARELAMAKYRKKNEEAA